MLVRFVAGLKKPEKKTYSSGIDIKDIPNVNDRDFSVTLNGFFLVRWRDPRLIIDNVDFGDNEPLIPVDVSLVSIMQHKTALTKGVKQQINV